MRVVNRLAAIVLGLLLLAVGALVVAETVLYLLDRPPWLLPLESWRDRLASTTLANSTFLTVSIIALVVGLLVILAQARPLRPQRLRAHPLAAPETAPAGEATAAPTPGGETETALGGEVVPGQPAEVAAAGNGHGDWWLTRRSVERRAVRAAGRVWGVYDVKARASGKPDHWRLAMNATGPRDGDPAEVEHAVRDELAALTAPSDVPVSTRLRHGHRRVE
jgi:hypothetical protein